MNEITPINALLFAWAVIATAKAWEMHRFIHAVYLMHDAMMRDERVYKKMSNKYFEVNK
jgi:hypothetical protein